MCKVNHKSLIYQCFHEILSHLALFYFQVWHCFTYPFGIVLLTRLAAVYSVKWRWRVFLRLSALLPATTGMNVRRSTTDSAISPSFASHCSFRLPSIVLQRPPVLFATLFSLCFTSGGTPFPCRFPCLTLQRLPHRNDGFNHEVFT